MKRGSQSGFSLLEVLVATTLTAIVVAALMTGISGALRNLGRAEGYEKAVLVGRTQLNRLLIEQLEPGQTRGRWDSDYRWVADVWQWNPAESPNVAGLPPVMVVRLTVFWKTGAGEKNAVFETSKYQKP